MSEWRRSKATGRRDANEPDIRRVVEQEFGGSFARVSLPGGPDAFVAIGGHCEPWEIKNGKAKLRPGQKTWAEAWQGPKVQVVRTEAHARKRMRMLTERAGETRIVFPTQAPPFGGWVGGGVDAAIEENERGCACDGCHCAGKDEEAPA